MLKFKVGDKVKVLVNDANSSSFKKGETFIITEAFLEEAGDRHNKYYNNLNYVYVREENLELVNTDWDE